MTTPAAAPAAPAAVAPDPAAPPAVPAAPAATPPADPAATPPAEPVKAKSLVPDDLGTPPATPAAPAATPPATPPAPEDGSEWMLYDGVKGTGKMPDWFRADKYKTVAAQAEAYSHLERRLGAFSGAPKEGKYEAPPMPEGVEGEFLTDHPVFETFTKWAIENQVSQKAYGEVLGMLATYEASQAPNFDDAKKQIGENADRRVQDVSLWAKANMDEAGYATYREALGGTNAAQVFQVIEAIVGKTRQPALPKPGALPGDVPVSPLAEINAMQAKVNPVTGKRFYEEDAKYRADVEKKRTAYFTAIGKAA